MGFDAVPLYVSMGLLYDCVLGPAEYTNVRLIIVCAVFFVRSLLIAICAGRNIVKGLSTTLRDDDASRR